MVFVVCDGVDPEGNVIQFRARHVNAARTATPGGPVPTLCFPPYERRIVPTSGYRALCPIPGRRMHVARLRTKMKEVRVGA